MGDVGAASEIGIWPVPRKFRGNGRNAPRGPRPDHVRERIAASMRAARAREDRTPTACPSCPAGPFQGSIGLRHHRIRKHPETLQEV
jgi:hypothetical protein